MWLHYIRLLHRIGMPHLLTDSLPAWFWTRRTMWPNVEGNHQPAKYRSLILYTVRNWIIPTKFSSVQFSSVQLLSCVRLFVTPWTAAHQASLSITNSRSLLKLMPIESVIPSNHLFLCQPLLLLPSIFPSIRVFNLSHHQWVGSSHQVAKVFEFQLQHQSLQWIFRTDSC